MLGKVRGVKSIFKGLENKGFINCKGEGRYGKGDTKMEGGNRREGHEK